MNLKTTILIFVILILSCAVYGFYVKNKNMEANLDKEKAAAYLDGFTDGVMK
jgi:uncharacterized protein YneF (UPF0154 family)